jgi:hypothetical protein
MRSFFLAALCLLASCKQTAQVDQEWRGSVPESLEFGAPFDLELRRSWPAGWQADPWNPVLWAPFEVEILEESRKEATDRVEVRRKLRLRVHALGEQRLQLAFSALDSIGGQRVAAQDLELSSLVQSGLPQADTGQAEFPAALAAPRTIDLERRFGALGLLLLVLGLGAACASWRRRPVSAATNLAHTDLWTQFRSVQEMPRTSEAERRAALQAARNLVRALEENQAWTAPELAQLLARRFALPRTEAASLAHFLKETEAAVFADQQEVLPALDPALDELAEVLRAVEAEGGQ